MNVFIKFFLVFTYFPGTINSMHVSLATPVVSREQLQDILCGPEVR